MSAPANDTVPDLLRALLGREPGRPLVTAYDELTGERTELSVTTWANWVAKVANLFTEEYLLDPGDTVRLTLPPHWLTTVFLGAAWTAGFVVTGDNEVPADLVVGGPDVATGDVPALACSLLPFAVRFRAAAPAGADDFGALWPGQPDVFSPVVPPEADAVAWIGGPTGPTFTQGALLSRAREVAATRSGRRLLTDVDPMHEAATTTLLPALVAGGSLVLVSSPADEQWPARHDDERATDVLRLPPG